MKAILTTYKGPTDRKGSRIIASDCDGNKVIVPYDYSSRDPHETAAKALCVKLGWKGRLIPGWTKTGKVFVFDNPDGFEV